MRKRAAFLPIILFVSASVAGAADVGFDLNINVGNQPRQVAVPPPPVMVPVPVPPPVVMEEPPMFIAPSSLGFYAAVGVPYDLFYVSGAYYLYRGNGWYQAPRYNGPWVGVSYRRLPPGLRRHKFEKIRHYRDEEYRMYRGGETYRGRHFRPEKEWKERRKEDRERWKEDKRAEKEDRKRHKHHRDND